MFTGLGSYVKQTGNKLLLLRSKTAVFSPKVTTKVKCGTYISLLEKALAMLIVTRKERVTEV